MSARRPTGRSAARRGSGARRRTPTTRRRYPRRRSVSSAVGTALGTLVVAAVLDLSWPARIGLVALLVGLVVGYLVWHNRAATTETGTGIEPARPEDDPPAPQDRPS